MKKLGTLALAVALTASLAVPAFAAEGNVDLPITTAPTEQSETQPETVVIPEGERYRFTLTLNGVTLDTSALSDVDGIPLRLMAENDHSYVDWFADESRAFASLDGNSVYVDVPSGRITLNDVVLEDMTATIRRGRTFMPVEFFDLLEGYSVNTNPELDENRYDVTTPNGRPMIQLAYAIQDQAETAMGMKTDEEWLISLGIDPAAFDEFVAFIPMMTSPDTIVVAKLAEGADLDAVKAGLETYRQNQEDTFSWYLSHNLPKVQDARLEVNGDYVLFLIAENADLGVELFNAFVAEQTEA